MEKTAQTSLLDLLVRLMPDWKDEITIIRQRKSPVNQKAAKTLFSIWLDAKNRVSERKFKRPDGISLNDITAMEKEGLVAYKSGELEVTAKGVQVIKTMLLGDERSSYEDDGKILEFSTAFANTKPQRVKVGTKSASAGTKNGANWYKNIVANKWKPLD